MRFALLTISATPAPCSSFRSLLPGPRRHYYGPRHYAIFITKSGLTGRQPV